MNVISKLFKGFQLLSWVSTNPREVYEVYGVMRSSKTGKEFSHRFRPSEIFPATGEKPKDQINRLEEFFDSRTEGYGIWKWRHYFDIYHRHLSKFVGRNVNLVEIGVFSGGSLDMWRHYFGNRCEIYGVDIEEVCKAHEGPQTHILIGDQEDREFWRNFRTQVTNIDVVVDDGGHRPNQQIVTLEELLPHISPGGVYICEDVYGAESTFYRYCSGLTKTLNGFDGHPDCGIRANSFQRWVKGVYFYPFLVVIERSERPFDKLIAPKHGTIWQPIKI